MDVCEHHDQANKKRRYCNTNVSDAVDASASSQQLQPTVDTANRFEILSDLDPNDAPLTGVNIGSQATTIRSAKKSRLPPISIINIGTKQTRELLNLSNVNQTEYHMKAVKSGTQLTAFNEETFNAAINVLRDGNKEFFTHTPANKQPVRVILSGLPLYDLTALKDELHMHDVHPLETKVFSSKMVGTEESVLYLLCFEKGTIKLSDLRKVTGLFSTTVKWRFFTKSAMDAVQCHRCQRFGHGMRHCFVSPLCVKCGEKHATSSCKLPAKAALKNLSSTDQKTLRSEIRCANCSGNHTANFRGCPARKNYLKELEVKRLRSAKNTTGSRSQPQHAHPRLPNSNASMQNQSKLPTGGGGLTFSQVLQGVSTQQPTAAEDADLFSVTEFMCLAKDLFQRLKGCRSKMEQFLALSELILSYVYNV